MTLDHQQLDLDADVLRFALERRLKSVARLFTGLGHHDDTDGLIEAMALAAASEDNPKLTWLLLTAIAGAYAPFDNSLEAHADLLRTAPGALKERVFAHVGLFLNLRSSNVLKDMLVVDTCPVVDVTDTANINLNTGIQRVVRRTVTEWESTNDFVLTSASDGSLQELHKNDQYRRVTAFEFDDPRVVVPWGVPLIVMEIPYQEVSSSLATLAKLGVCEVSVVGHDLIPLLPGISMQPVEVTKFVSFLELLKWSGKIAAVSHASADQFASYQSMLSPQGIDGPRVRGIPLPIEMIKASRKDQGVMSRRKRPMVLSVGTLTPRKNQWKILIAAENLWSQGHDFELVFVGHITHQYKDTFVPYLKKVARTHPVRIVADASDEELFDLYKECLFVVGASLFEGYGLTVAESIAHWKPVITSKFGSQAEIAAGGGALMCDPNSADEIAKNMELLLTQPEELSRLMIECQNRPARGWTEYARELWAFLVGDGVSSV